MATRNVSIELKIKLLDHYQGLLPKYESAQASGFDVRAQLSEEVNLGVGERALIPTALVFEIPKGFELQVRPRSGLALKKGLTIINAPGTIDEDYRGELKIIMINHGREKVMIANQDRIAQVVLCPVYQAQFSVVDQVDTSLRGEKGFGSTGFN